MTVSGVTSDDTLWAAVLGRLAESGHQVAMVVTGGGAGALGRCFRRAGASRNFVEAIIPYSHAALTDYLGAEPEDSSASEAVARQLANVAWQRATRLVDEPAEAVAGLALVAALPTSRPRRGEDRIHVALKTSESCRLWSLRLEKNAYSREAAESIADEIILVALAWLVGEANAGRFLSGLSLETRQFET